MCIIRGMQTLRHAHWLTRLLLVWFALFIGVSVASPMVKPVAGQMVCTAMGGMKMVMDGDDGKDVQPAASMDCPLCAPMVAMPASLAQALNPASSLAYVLRTIPGAHIAGLTGAPLPPRGPPVLN